MAPKAEAEADGTGEPNAALVHAEAATCLTAPMQPLQLFVWPATVKFHARHLAVHKTHGTSNATNIFSIRHDQFAGL